MPVTITFLGHSGFLLEAGGARVAIDPFLTGNPVGVHQPEDIRCDHVVLTHGHSDHFGDTVAIAQRNGATVYGAFEVCLLAGQRGVPEAQLNAGNPGGKIKTEFGYVAFTQAFHSSSNDGVYTGTPCGVVVRFEAQDFTFYHLGDTGLFSDLRLLGEIYRPDVCAVPVGDRFTMGPELGARAAEFVGAKAAIPVHWGTWPLLTSDVSAFRPEGVKVRMMEPGERWAYADVTA
jgi:L-ascorbate metabolism protein UlaG (beta-lactamase superfamily)